MECSVYIGCGDVTYVGRAVKEAESNGNIW
jgi:hypothetical protein